MAMLSHGPSQMAAWINSTLTQLDANVQMFIVPLAGVEALQQVTQCLFSLNGYEAAQGNGEIGILSPGLIKLNAARTVDDAIAELNGPMVSLSEMGALLNCIREEFVEGKVVKANTRMGELLVDREALAQELGLPLTSSEQALFTVFVPTIYKRSPRDQRIFIAVRGEAPAVKPTVSTSLETFFPLLEERQTCIFDTPASFHLKDTNDVWQLLSHSRFNEILSLLRSGRSYKVWCEDDHLVMSY